jgi:hypothetical protein
LTISYSNQVESSFSRSSHNQQTNLTTNNHLNIGNTISSVEFEQNQKTNNNTSLPDVVSTPQPFQPPQQLNNPLLVPIPTPNSISAQNPTLSTPTLSIPTAKPTAKPTLTENEPISQSQSSTSATPIQKDKLTKHLSQTPDNTNSISNPLTSILSNEILTFTNVDRSHIHFTREDSPPLMTTIKEKIHNPSLSDSTRIPISSFDVDKREETKMLSPPSTFTSVTEPTSCLLPPLRFVLSDSLPLLNIQRLNGNESLPPFREDKISTMWGDEGMNHNPTGDSNPNYHFCSSEKVETQTLSYQPNQFIESHSMEVSKTVHHCESGDQFSFQSSAFSLTKNGSFLNNYYFSSHLIPPSHNTENFHLEGRFLVQARNQFCSLPPLENFRPFGGGGGDKSE